LPAACRPPLETFVVLCGMPRCGTRQFADFLNAHPRLCLQGEIRSGLLGTIRATLDAGDSAYASGYAANYYRQKRAQGVIDLFTLLSKRGGSASRGPTCTGSNARRWSARARRSPPSSARHSPRCTGCTYPQSGRLLAVAHGHAVVFRQPRPVRGRYCDSLDHARAIAERSGAERGGTETGAPRDARRPPPLAMGTTIAALDLDAFIASADKPGWLGQHLFAPLGLAPSAAELAHFAATTDNRNATSAPRAARGPACSIPPTTPGSSTMPVGSKRPSPPTTRGWARAGPAPAPLHEARIEAEPADARHAA
jgi:hypothetical protein